MKKSHGTYTTKEKREFIADHWQEFGGVKRGCKMLNMARSSYYYKEGNDFRKQKEDADLRDRIEKIVVEHERYGYRRVTAQLKREGLKVNHKRVQRVMRQEGLICKIKKRWITTTDSKHKYPIYPNLLKSTRITGVNQAWVADITYIRILTAFVYLAVILDVFSRKVIGWAISMRIDTELTRAALRMAIEIRHPSDGCIHHSDRGVQYAAHEYVDDLNAAGMRISMARKGNP
ncbi:MAG: IS3 family transposase, partial [Thermodesulfovibrionia bacterium]|nr:IS3 family transposase [Thermodesulfovibrionia bacterium]